MPQDTVIRSDAQHVVDMPEGGGPAVSKRGSTSFGAQRVQASTRKALVPSNSREMHWAQYEDQLAISSDTNWEVRPARVTHVGRPQPKRVDFRTSLKSLRGKNAELRGRLNQLLAAPKPLKKV